MSIKYSKAMELLKSLEYFNRRREMGENFKEAGLEQSGELIKWCERIERDITPFAENDLTLLFTEIPLMSSLLSSLIFMNDLHQAQELIDLLKSSSETDFLSYLNGELRLTGDRVSEEILSAAVDDLGDFSVYDVDFDLLKRRLLFVYEKPRQVMDKLIFLLELFWSKYTKIELENSRVMIKEKELWHHEQYRIDKTDYLNSVTLDHYSHFYKPEEEVPLYLSYFMDLNLTLSRDPHYIVLGINRDKVLLHDRQKDRADLFYKGVGDMKRVEILRLLKVRKYFGRELARHFNLSSAAMFHHIRILMTAGLIQSEEGERKKLYYSINRERLDELLESVRADLGP